MYETCSLNMLDTLLFSVLMQENSKPAVVNAEVAGVMNHSYCNFSD